MITVHLIFNAHIDPVWLWGWPAGLDEVLATCRSACDRLDAHPDLYFSRGEAWAYREVERLDPELFERIRGHVASGRWEIVGGWWLQPDCNLPSRWGMERQMALGRQYFTERFGEGAFPRIGYNVDSFGHAAALPGLMRAAGQDRYIMMRPQENEMALPARLFRWRGAAGGPEVTTFRIAAAYTTRAINRGHIEASLRGLPEGIEHTMCFVGVGDHGGGPTEGQIRWCREHADAFPGARLVFSTPSRFFDAVASQTGDLPLVTGELQMHAIGCYSVYRPVKTALRRAERLLESASTTAPEGRDAERLTEAAERVCFGHFHDTLGGTCLPSAYTAVLDQLGGAAAVGDEFLQHELRRRLRALPDDSLQRIVVWNPGTADFSGPLEFEPWLEWQGWRPEWTLIDESEQAVPFQTVASEAMTGGLVRLLWQARIPAGELRVLRIRRDGAPVDGTPSGVTASAERIVAGGTACDDDGLTFGAASLKPALHLIAEPSDTWSHRLDRYAEGPVRTPHWNGGITVDAGPLMASRIRTGTIGGSTLSAEWRVYSGEPFVELILNVHWQEAQRLLKLTLPLPEGTASHRRDFVMGEWVERPNDGRELPLHEATLLPGTSGAIGVVSPDIFALDATERRLRLTLLRSPWMAHHDPFPAGTHPRGVVSDQGVHTFRLRFFCGPEATSELLQAHARALTNPPLAADLTRGMPAALGLSGVG